MVHEPRRRARDRGSTRAPHRAACDPAQLLDPKSAADGTWIVDKGKGDGSSPGFRVTIPGKGKYMFKGEPADQPEQPSAASAIGAAVYYARRLQHVVRADRLLQAFAAQIASRADAPRPTSASHEDFDRKALDKMLAGRPKARQRSCGCRPRRGCRVTCSAHSDMTGRAQTIRTTSSLTRTVASCAAADSSRRGSITSTRASRTAWTPGYRRGRGGPESSPGHVVHYYLDTSDCLGSEWGWDEVSRRLGYSYILDWGDIGADFVTLGIPSRPWDRVRRVPGTEMFGYFDVKPTSCPTSGRTSTPTPPSAA